MKKYEPVTQKVKNLQDQVLDQEIGWPIKVKNRNKKRES